MTKTNTPALHATDVFLYVTDVSASARFYAGLLGVEPTGASTVFAIFILPSGPSLGLWDKGDVKPAPVAGGGGSEIGLKVGSAALIDDIHADWQAKGATIAFPPTDLPFGRSFVALDPDGHRLRVFAPA
jgi:predicted enzyme related to lactoylglutathione lyase